MKHLSGVLFFILILMNSSPATESTTATSTSDTAVFGGGCFWCTEAMFKEIPGVEKVASGFAGGSTTDPSYKEVCGENTGHAEVIQVTFNPAKISYSELLEFFWLAHDPTTLNRQGNDTGTQYRSIILYKDDAQKAAAEKAKIDAQKHFSSPITTQIVKLDRFYKAEDYHQNYFANNPTQPYCQAVVGPKLQHFKEKLAERQKSKGQPH